MDIGVHIFSGYMEIFIIVRSTSLLYIFSDLNSRKYRAEILK